MFPTQVVLSAIVCATISLSASIGFAQEFYQQVEMYSEPYTSYQVDSGHYVSEPITTSDYITTEVSAYDSAEVATEAYGGFTVVQEGGVQVDAVQGTVIESDIVYGDAIYADGVQGQATMEAIVSPDFGYEGPGDMRTHLWEHHSEDLEANGVSKSQLDAMSMETVQKWHNFFHGSEGRPE